ncbi:SusD family protein [compost metagenome]
MDDLSKVFLNNSTGTLWQLAPNNVGGNTTEASNFILVSGPPPFRALSPVLLNAFESGDQRKTKWVGSVSKGTDTWYYAYKYKENKPTTVSKEYAILFRLEEMYFIRAEAQARLGKLALAAADLNKIRNRAGLDNTTAGTESELVAAIIKERRIEFFTELGHRWLDLKRTGQLDAVLTAVKPGWNTTDALWPLPENELRLNPNLRPQNTGY